MEDDKFAAIGIGAMIVFIALILVAAVAAVIIQTAEKLQQNAQSTGDDTSQSMNGKIMVSTVVAGTGAATDYEIYARLAPGSEPLATDQIFYQIICENSATPIEGSDPVVDEMDQTNADIATILPSMPVMITIPGAGCAPNAANNLNTGVQLYIHAGGGGTSFETLNIPAQVDPGTPLI